MVNIHRRRLAWVVMAPKYLPAGRILGCNDHVVVEVFTAFARLRHQHNAAVLSSAGVLIECGGRSWWDLPAKIHFRDHVLDFLELRKVGEEPIVLAKTRAFK